MLEISSDARRAPLQEEAQDGFRKIAAEDRAIMSDADFFREEPPGYGGGGKPAPLPEYLRKLEHALKRGDATEHTHRPALKELIEALDENVVCTNEPRRSACGAPDYVVSRKRDQLTIGYIEAKDIGADLAREERGKQLERYLPALPNLLLTDYLEFRWFVDGKKRETFRLANVAPGGRLAPGRRQRKWNAPAFSFSISRRSSRRTLPPPRSWPAVWPI